MHLNGYHLSLVARKHAGIKESIPKIHSGRMVGDSTEPSESTQSFPLQVNPVDLFVFSE